MHWVPLSPFIPVNSRQVFTYRGLSILLINQNNIYYAIENLCSHESLPLAEGELTNTTLTCPYHGAQFCIKTGEVLAPPAFDNIRTFPVRITTDMVEIQID